jgi:GNAT superfamily N-acetyltransferase
MASAATPDPVPTPSSPDVALPEGYTIHSGFPPIPTYIHLRAVSGLHPKTPAQAAPIAHNSWYGCYVTFSPTDTDTNNISTKGEETIVAMGRIIGDGGWYFHIADMAVLPEHQRKGLGDAVLKHLMEHIKTHAPQDGTGTYVTLFADAPGRRLYAKNGFVETMPGQMGMAMPLGWERS